MPDDGRELNSRDVKLMENENLQSRFARLPLTVVRLCGSDRAKFLHNFCTAEIKKLPTDHCTEAFFLNHKGKTVSHGIVVCREIDLLIVSTSKSASVLLENLDKFLLSEDVQLSDVSSLWRCVFVFGESADATLALSQVQVPAEGNIANIGFQVVLRAELAGQGVLILEAADGDVDIASVMESHGAAECSLQSFHARRIEQQTPWCESEITDACLTQEFRRDAKAVSYTKGCYLGQETVARLDALGHVNRLLAGFEIVDGKLNVGDEIRKDDKKIGIVTSLAEQIGLGFLRVEHATSGEVIQCQGATIKVR